MSRSRGFALSVAALLLAALAALALWQRGDGVAVWTANDLQRQPGATESEPGELSLPRREVTVAPGEGVADAGAAGEQDSPRTLTLRGRVLDTRGVAVAGAQVQLELRGQERERVRKPTTTGTDGAFAFRGPLRGVRTVGVYASHRDFAPTLVDREVPANATDALTLGDITLGRGARVRGSVVHSAGHGLADAAVELSPESGGRLFWSHDGKRRLPAQTTDGGGSFTFTHVPPGAYRVVARATRTVPNSSESFAVVDDADVALQPITLQAGALLTGLVIDRRGRGVEKAQVQVISVGNPGPQPQVVTGADGRFTLDQLRVRLSDVRVSANGFVTQRTRVDLSVPSDVTITLDDGLRLRGQVRDAQTGQPIETFAMQARRLRSLGEDMPAEFAGRARPDIVREMAEVNAARRDKPDDATLLARLATLTTALHALDAHNAEANANEDGGLPQDPGAVAVHPGGAFEITGLDGGVYAVDIAADGYLLTRSAAAELRVARDTPPLAIDLACGFRLRGQVVRGSDGSAVAKARVEVMSLAKSPANARRAQGPTIASAISADDGTFTLTNVRPGRCATQVVARGFDTAVSQPFEVRADVDDLRLELAARAALVGRVLGIPNGREGDVSVVAFAGFRSVMTRPPAADATYRLEELPPGSYHVRAYLGDSRTAVRRLSTELRRKPPPPPDVALAAGEVRTLDVQVAVVAVSTVRGLARVNGAAAAGYQAQLVGDAGAPSEGQQWSATYAQQIESDGTFTFPSVEPGSYQVRILSIASDRIELARERVQVVPGQDSNLVLAVGTAACEGQVVAEDGRPIDGTVRLLPPGERVEQQPTERPAETRQISLRVRGGRFRADVLPVGKFDLELQTGNEREVVRQQIEFTPGERRELTLTAGARKAKGDGK